MKKLGAELTYYKNQVRSNYRKGNYRGSRNAYGFYTMNGGKKTYDELLKKVKK